MKYKILLATMLFANLAFCKEIEMCCDDGYQDKICGDDYSCSAKSCIFKDTDLTGAYKRYFKKYIDNSDNLDEGDKAFSRAYQKAMNESRLPDVGKTTKMQFVEQYKLPVYQDSKGRYIDMEITCEFEFKMVAKDHLHIQFNECSRESLYDVDFKQNGKNIEMILRGFNGA